ncbi:MAG: sensor histidine kinase [Marinifilaceae bacterium]
MEKRPTYKELERQLKDALHRAQEAEELKNAFLANMSHEIRTPMNAIIGASELLRDQNLTVAERNEFANILSTSSRELLELFNRIIELSEMESGQCKLNEAELDLQILFLKLYSKYEVRIKEEKKNITLSYTQQIPDISFFTDSDKLNKVLSHLLDNAVKYTTNGNIEFGCNLQDHNNLLFYVKDTGPGISIKEQENIFQKFRQIDNSYTREYSGAGLGLSLSKETVKILGGRLYIDSIPGEGSIFYFTLPLKYSETNNTLKEKIENTLKRSFINKYSLENLSKNIAI